MGRMTALAVVIVMAMAIMSSSEAAACFLPPDDQRVKPEQLVARTGRIALAKVVAIEPVDQGVRYRFQRVEALKGVVASTFTIDGEREMAQSDDDFHGHRDNASGQVIGGRTPNWPDCAIHPSFQEGGRYLVFLDRPYHPWSFERIVVDDDRWLREVRRLTGRQ